eukprot:5247357-Prymnesium_polylepis.1
MSLASFFRAPVAGRPASLPTTSDRPRSTAAEPLLWRSTRSHAPARGLRRSVGPALAITATMGTPRDSWTASSFACRSSLARSPVPSGAPRIASGRTTILWPSQCSACRRGATLALQNVHVTPFDVISVPSRPKTAKCAHGDVP